MPNRVANQMSHLVVGYRILVEHAGVEPNFHVDAVEAPRDGRGNRVWGVTTGAWAALIADSVISIEDGADHTGLKRPQILGSISATAPGDVRIPNGS
jgi:hypothetical protein